jgi:hypothetical protein
MTHISPTWTMIGLDALMIVYTLWVLSLRKPTAGSGVGIGLGLIAWLAVLHFGLANEALFPTGISGPAFLAVIFGAVGVVGAALMLMPAARKIVWALDQEQLLLLQGIRSLFGATFLMFASTGALPQTFGIIDGFTHTGAGFFGLIAAFSLASGANGRRRAWFANFFGLADILIVASSLALILLPQIGPHHPMMYAVFLPAPLWLWCHVVSMVKLMQTAEPTRASAPA